MKSIPWAVPMAVFVIALVPAPTSGTHGGAPGTGGLDGWVDVHGDTMSGTLTMNDAVLLFANGALDASGGAAGLRFDGDRVCTSGLVIEGCGGGDITAVLAGPGLAGGGTVGAVSLEVAAGGINTLMIADNTVSTQDIADNTITAADLADNGVTSGDIADNTLNSVDVADNTLTTVDVADNNLRSVDLLDGDVQTVDLASGAVTPAKTTFVDQVATGTIDLGSTAAGAVGCGQMSAPGAPTGAPVVATPSSAMHDAFAFHGARVANVGVVEVCWLNASAAAVDPGSVSVWALVLK